MAQTMFERYGGFSKLNQVVSAFYEKMLDSPTTSPYFANVDMRRLIDHQTKFIAFLMGGPASYTNDHLERVHADLGVTEAAFVEAVTLLTETLEDFGFSAEDLQEVRDALMRCKNFIVARK